METPELAEKIPVTEKRGRSASIRNEEAARHGWGTPIAQRPLPLELLAPAGGREQLEYAIRFGADAVYLAVDRFGMRRRATNFTMDDLPGAVRYAHDRGVAVHLACNTVMHESDLASLRHYLEQAQQAGVDALIVSDLGALRLARAHAPNVAVHVSTQASIANSQAALAWYELGAQRIVCARELSVAQIAELRSQVPAELEIEVFAHGSMCMAYAGRCMISDYLTGRGANDGNCTQPCRWAWTLHEPSRPGQEFTVEEDEEATYLFNSCDLNMLGHLADLAKAGVCSIKLEGRGRGAFYAATVTGAYRRVLEGADPLEVARELDTFSHHPYSTGFFYGPAHQAPASGASEQRWLWVAEVLACEPSDDGAWEALVIARNRFDTASNLEVVSPGKASETLAVETILWVHEDEDGNRVEEPTTAANRQMEQYRIRCNRKLQPYDILRACR